MVFKTVLGIQNFGNAILEFSAFVTPILVQTFRNIYFIQFFFNFNLLFRLFKSAVNEGQKLFLCASPNCQSPASFASCSVFICSPNVRSVNPYILSDCLELATVALQSCLLKQENRVIGYRTDCWHFCYTIKVIGKLFFSLIE